MPVPDTIHHHATPSVVLRYFRIGVMNDGCVPLRRNANFMFLSISVSYNCNGCGILTGRGDCHFGSFLD